MELRRSESGKDWCRLSVGVEDGGELTWVSVAVFEEKARALTGLAKGVEVYDTLDRPRRRGAHGAIGLGVARRGPGEEAQAAAVVLEDHRKAVETLDLERRLAAIEQKRNSNERRSRAA